MRDSQGQLSTRRMAATEMVTKPVAAISWSEVPSRVRQWETNLLDFEIVGGRPLDPLVKTEAFLRLLPATLRELALNQRGLENNFPELRDYVLHQAGRRRTTETERQAPAGEKSDGASPMDLSAMMTIGGRCGEERSEIVDPGHDVAFWYGSSGKGAKPGSRNVATA